MRAAPLLGALALLLAAPAAVAPGADVGPVSAGVAGPGERVLLGTSGLAGTTISYALAASTGMAQGTLVRVRCVFACFEAEMPAPLAGQEVLHPFQGGEYLYLVASESAPLAYVAVTLPHGFALDLCPSPPQTDFLHRGHLRAPHGPDACRWGRGYSLAPAGLGL